MNGKCTQRSHITPRDKASFKDHDTDLPPTHVLAGAAEGCAHGRYLVDLSAVKHAAAGEDDGHFRHGGAGNAALDGVAQISELFQLCMR